MEINFDINGSKEVDLNPNTKPTRRRKKNDDYDYEDPFIEVEENENDAIELECHIENFFVYAGVLEDESAKVLKKYTNTKRYKIDKRSKQKVDDKKIAINNNTSNTECVNYSENNFTPNNKEQNNIANKEVLDTKQRENKNKNNNVSLQPSVKESNKNNICNDCHLDETFLSATVDEKNAFSDVNLHEKNNGNSVNVNNHKLNNYTRISSIIDAGKKGLTFDKCQNDTKDTKINYSSMNKHDNIISVIDASDTKNTCEENLIEKTVSPGCTAKISKQEDNANKLYKKPKTLNKDDTKIHLGVDQHCFDNDMKSLEKNAKRFVSLQEFKNEFNTERD
ncbi:hypothetical protein COBT_000235, partial [Conglomerata obtusa]